MATLTLVQIRDTAAPAAFHELAAAKYIGSNRTHFRELVKAGVIPYTRHLNKTARIYLRRHLDAYLDSLEESRMGVSENPPVVALTKGAQR